jgi:hypothetical protein
VLITTLYSSDQINRNEDQRFWKFKENGVIVQELLWICEVKRSLGRNRHSFKDENDVDL